MRAIVLSKEDLRKISARQMAMVFSNDPYYLMEELYSGRPIQLPKDGDGEDYDLLNLLEIYTKEEIKDILKEAEVSYEEETDWDVILYAKSPYDFRAIWFEIRTKLSIIDTFGTGESPSTEK